MNNIDKIVNDFELDLKEYISSIECEETLRSSMAYSLLAGGKRLRPLLIMSSAKACNLPLEKVRNMAIAMEMIHTYSLIHDDLPAMDNDDFRRGKLTNHRKYSEAIAILAGDALLNEAHTILIRDYCFDSSSKNASLYISQKAGRSGMINGQVIDMESENNDASLDTISKMHKDKTGALINAALVAPFILSDKSNEEISNISSLGDKLGILFQIQDDILDVISDSETMGKTIGKDNENSKSTYVTLLGLDKSREILDDLKIDIMTSLDKIENNDLLVEVINLIINRKK